MKSYKVEIAQTDTFTMDVQAENEEQARSLAEENFATAIGNGTYHYYQSGDTETEVSNVYDVTGTDDAITK